MSLVSMTWATAMWGIVQCREIKLLVGLASGHCSECVAFVDVVT